MDPGYMMAMPTNDSFQAPWCGPPNKALAIRNPKTGEIISPQGSAAQHKVMAAVVASPMMESDQQDDARKMRMESNRQAFMDRSNLIWAAKSKAATKLMAQRSLHARWRADHSTFSALHIEVADRKQATKERHTADVAAWFGSGFGGWTPDHVAGPPARGEDGDDLGPEEPTTEELIPQQDEDGTKEATVSVESAAVDDDGGVASRRPWRAAVARSPVLTAASLPNAEQAPGDFPELQGGAATKRPWRKRSNQDRQESTSAEEGTAASVAESLASSADIPDKWVGSIAPHGAIDEVRSYLLSFRHAVRGVSPPPELKNLTCKDSTSPAKAPQLPVEAPRRADPRIMLPPTVCGDDETPAHPASSSPGTAPSPGGQPTTPSCRVGRSGNSAARRIFELSCNQLTLPTPSEKAYRRPGGEVSRSEELTRTVKSLLNKICPENVGSIGDKIGEVKVADAGELELVIVQIFRKALAEPHYCETYADLVFSLKSIFPEFPAEDGGSKKVSFKTTLLNICQQEFESLPSSLDPSEDELATLDQEELDYRRKKRKDRLLANMKFIGHLFLRQLLSPKVIGAVLQELALCNEPEVTPVEHVIECICELLTCVGYTLESLPSGQHALTQVCGRLLDLKQRKDSSGRFCYSRRLQFYIQDLLDTRNAGWTKKTFKSSAKTKEEIRMDQQRELAAQSAGKTVTHAEMVVAGQRPLYVTAMKEERL